MKPIVFLLLSVAVARATVTVTQSSDDGPHPSSMELEVTLPDSNERVLIPLERTDAFENVPMTVVENGVSRTFSSRQVHHVSHAHYRNVATKSVISVRHVNGKRQIHGHVMHEGTSYFLEPMGDNEHKVVKNERTHKIMARQEAQIQVQSRRKRQTNTSPTTNKVEIYLLLDSTVWNGFMTLFGSEAVALTELHYYYTHILNGIDVTYRNIGKPSISVSCIGLTIAKTAADDAWMPPSSLEGGDILNQMKNYITGKTADHFMAFTRKDITGDGSSSVCGMAFLARTCTDSKVSINEDQGLQSWGTASHELAHNLGANHDGDGNDCTAATKNLMAPSSSFYKLEDVANSYQFSSCSVNYMNNYINSLGSASCLLKDDGSRVNEFTKSEREGTRMTLDQVCRFSYLSGPGKFFISSGCKSNPAIICAKIYCQNAAGGGASTGGLRAPVGTPCGNQKSCDWTGQCTADPSAPAADESCFWGDIWAASDCSGWKTSIEKKWDTCTSDVKKSCCKTLAGVAGCAGV